MIGEMTTNAMTDSLVRARPDGVDEVHRRGDGNRQQQLHRNDDVHLADEGPPHLRALDQVRRTPAGLAHLRIVAAVVLLLAHAGWRLGPLLERRGAFCTSVAWGAAYSNASLGGGE
jgi:hypothetical protein